MGSSLSFACVFGAFVVFFFEFLFFAITKPSSIEKAQEHAAQFWKVSILPLIFAFVCNVVGTLVYADVWNRILVLKLPGQIFNDGSTEFTDTTRQGHELSISLQFGFMFTMVSLVLLLTIPIFG